MKKVIFTIIALVGILFCGCSANDSVGKVDTQPETTAAEITTASAKENKITQTGSHGSISITLPDGWSYRLLGKGDKGLLSGDYGIQFYPSDVKKGFIELAYHSAFGVCGTGLKEEEIKLAGDTANAGYYDGSKIWEFVIFNGKNDKIAAVSSSAEKWQAKYSEQIMSVLDTLVYTSNGNADDSNEDAALTAYISDYNVIPNGKSLPVITLSDEDFESLILELETIFESSCYQFDISKYKEEYGIEGLRKSSIDESKFYCKYTNETGSEYVYILFNQKQDEKLYDWNYLYIKSVNGKYKILYGADCIKYYNNEDIEMIAEK